MSCESLATIWEVAIGSERLVAKHLIRKVAKLDVQTKAVVEPGRYRIEKAPEDKVLVYPLVVFALAINAPVQIDYGRQQGPRKNIVVNMWATTCPVPSSAIAIQGSCIGVASSMRKKSTL